MTDDELRGLIADSAILQAKADERFARLEASREVIDAQLAKNAVQQAKTDELLDRLAVMYGGASNNQGAVAEEFYYNSLKANPVIGRKRFDVITKNLTRSQNGIEQEFDLLLSNAREAYIIEVKYSAHLNDLERLFGAVHTNFQHLFPEYSGHRSYLGLAAFHVRDDVKRAVLSQGVTVLQRKGDVIETIAA